MALQRRLKPTKHPMWAYRPEASNSLADFPDHAVRVRTEPHVASPEEIEAANQAWAASGKRTRIPDTAEEAIRQAKGLRSATPSLLRGLLLHPDERVPIALADNPHAPCAKHGSFTASHLYLRGLREVLDRHSLWNPVLDAYARFAAVPARGYTLHSRGLSSCDKLRAFAEREGVDIEDPLSEDELPEALGTVVRRRLKQGDERIVADILACSSSRLVEECLRRLDRSLSEREVAAVSSGWSETNVSWALGRHTPIRSRPGSPGLPQACVDAKRKLMCSVIDRMAGTHQHASPEAEVQHRGTWVRLRPGEALDCILAGTAVQAGITDLLARIETGTCLHRDRALDFLVNMSASLHPDQQDGILDGCLRIDQRVDYRIERLLLLGGATPAGATRLLRERRSTMVVQAIARRDDLVADPEVADLLAPSSSKLVLRGLAKHANADLGRKSIRTLIKTDRTLANVTLEEMEEERMGDLFTTPESIVPLFTMPSEQIRANAMARLSEFGKVPDEPERAPETGVRGRER